MNANNNTAFVQTYFKLKNKDKEETEEKKFNARKYDKKRRLIRDDMQMVGKYGMPLVRKQDIEPDAIELLSYTKTKDDDNENLYKTVHFFTHDWNFDAVYNKPEESAEKLKQYYALLTPDFSMYPRMPLSLQIHSTFKNRWCGSFWQSLGLVVIPTVEWGDECSFEFCFDGIEEGSVVAVATYCRRNREGFMLGYNKMLEVIKPSAVICYGEPFNGMKGNIKVIQPYDHNELVEKLGREEYVKRYFEGDLYPS